MTARTYVDVHILHTVPPSNLNRDDTGSPKQAMYGGVRRARVSSQAWKRATRIAFADSVPAEQLATRTRKVSALLAERIRERTGITAEQSGRITTQVLAPLKISAGRKAEQTAYLLFFGRSQLEQIVDQLAPRAGEFAALDDDALTKATAEIPVTALLGAGHPIDVALFGRMVADLPSLNVDAATQVAHAISTHAVQTEFDYFTAVDDENPREDTGAGMIGTIEFNSATLYRFATVGIHQLADNLGGDTEAAMDALRLFLRAFTYSMPAGHQNSFAHRTPPSLVAVAVRADQPVNLVSAFEDPVRPTAGIAAESATRLARELRTAAQLWGLAPTHLAATYTPPGSQQHAEEIRSVLGPPVSFDDLVGATLDAVRAPVTSGASR